RRLTELYPDLEDRRLTERYTRALAGEISVLSTALHQYLLPFPPTMNEIGLSHMLQTVRIAPLHEGTEVVGTITIIEDVTQRETQASILRRQQELDRLLSSSLAVLLQSNHPADEIAGIFASISPALGLDAYASFLLSADEQTLNFHTSSGFSPKQRDSVSVLRLNPEDQRALHGSIDGLELNIAGHAETLRKGGVRACCSFPLAVGDRTLGLLSFASYEHATIPPADVSVLARIARYVAIALDRSLRERDTVAASRAKDDFLAALSHELRTPLNPVLLVASDAAENADYPAEAREAFKLIEKNALLEARLIDDLLDLTRIEHGKLSLEMQLLDVHATLSDALTTIRADVKERGLTLEVALRAEHFLVTGDAARLQQVFWNILKNAAKFTSGSGVVTVSSAYDETTKTIVIEISDTGIGMDTSEVTRVFGAFAQGDHALRGRSHRFGGLGLGLAISRKLVDLHGGRIEASSAGKDKGSTFTIHLPVVRPISPSAGREGTQSTGRSQPRDALARGKRGRILVVEDHEPTRVALTHLLQRRGFEIASAASATAALREAAQHPFDLVLSDIGLPDSDGFTLMRELRDRHGLKGVALTGYGMEEDLVRSNAAGFFAHLTKPINAKVLDRTLESVFSNPTA
ncbi:MAG: ATP-binding protein, partial [Opitutus sp.]